MREIHSLENIEKTVEEGAESKLGYGVEIVERMRAAQKDRRGLRIIVQGLRQITPLLGQRVNRRLAAFLRLLPDLDRQVNQRWNSHQRSSQLADRCEHLPVHLVCGRTLKLAPCCRSSRGRGSRASRFQHNSGAGATTNCTASRCKLLTGNEVLIRGAFGQGLLPRRQIRPTQQPVFWRSETFAQFSRSLAITTFLVAGGVPRFRADDYFPFRCKVAAMLHSHA